MEEAAVRIASPDWEIKPTDTIVLDVQYDEGYNYSEYTMDPGGYEISIQVQDENWMRNSTTYRNEDAVEFWKKLMNS